VLVLVPEAPPEVLEPEPALEQAQVPELVAVPEQLVALEQAQVPGQPEE